MAGAARLAAALRRRVHERLDGDRLVVVAEGDDLGVGDRIYVHFTDAHRPLLLDTATRTWTFTAPLLPPLVRPGSVPRALGAGDEVLVLGPSTPPTPTTPPAGG